VLELGCGDGRLTQAIAVEAAYMLAFDTDAEVVERARQALPTVEFRVASGREIEVERRSFDLALFFWSL
jgi:trans-aconitate methyltransferase